MKRVAGLRDLASEEPIEKKALKKIKLNSGAHASPHDPAASVCSEHKWESNTTLRPFHDTSLGLNADYYPRFFKSLDARSILRQLEREMAPYLERSRNEVVMMGRTIKIPRKQTAFGDQGLSYNFSGVSVPAQPWIPLLKGLRDHLAETLGEEFNFVLVNRYKDGSDYIGEHRDDEKDLVSKSSIASLSFGQKRDFVFKHRDTRGKNASRKGIEPIKLCLEHGSLLVMKYPTNTFWYHSLPVRKSAPGTRINLTFRRMKSI